MPITTWAPITVSNSQNIARSAMIPGGTPPFTAPVTLTSVVNGWFGTP